MERKMKRLIIAAALTTLTPPLYSAPIFQPYGPNLSYGSVSNGQTVLSDINNPAATAEKLESSDESWSMGILPHIGAGFEYGDVDNLYDEIDSAANEIDNAVNSFDGTNSQQTADQVNTAIADANRILSLVEDGGYGKAITSFQLPLTPLAFSGVLGGKLFFDGNAYATARLGALSEEINFDTTAIDNYINNIIQGVDSGPATFGDVTVDYDPLANVVTYDIRNDSTAVVKGAVVYDFGLGYSRKLFSSQNGKLYGGVKGKYYRVQLLRDIEKVSDLENSEDYFDNVNEDNAVTTSGFGLDFGVLWTTNQYHLGATVINLNEPSFDYNKIDLTGLQYTNQRIIDALTADEKYTMKRQLKLEAAKYFLDNKNVVLGVSFDANAIQDPVGDEYQWANASIAYITDHWLIPGARVGYRKNMAGSELSYIEGGLTWLYFNIDGGMALENVDVDGDSYPRGAYVNIGLELSF
jgi:hypothetical protein